jgi:penicillin-binding protein 1A
VGFDTNQSLGEKETGARAALPIWMTWMRAAIVGKDDEKFLGDEKDNSKLKASAQPLAKPQPPIQTRATVATVRPALASPAAGSPARTVNANAPVKPLPSSTPTGAAAKPPALPVAKRSVQPATSTVTDRSQVKPALALQPVPVKAAGAVKPALNSVPNPSKPKNQQ